MCMHVCIYILTTEDNICLSGGRLNKKDCLTRYDDSHVKDKTVFILRRGPVSFTKTIWYNGYIGGALSVKRRMELQADVTSVYDINLVQ